MKRTGPPSRGGPGADRKEVAKQKYNTRSGSGRASFSAVSFSASAIHSDASTTREIVLRLVVDQEHKVEFWLHVTPDGRELKSLHEPKDAPSLHIEIFVRTDGALIEETKVYYVQVLDGASHSAFRPTPRGHGWQYQGDTRDGTSSVWRRLHNGGLS